MKHEMFVQAILNSSGKVTNKVVKNQVLIVSKTNLFNLHFFQETAREGIGKLRKTPRWVTLMKKYVFETCQIFINIPDLTTNTVANMLC